MKSLKVTRAKSSSSETRTFITSPNVPNTYTIEMRMGGSTTYIFKVFLHKLKARGFDGWRWRYSSHRSIDLT